MLLVFVWVLISKNTRAKPIFEYLIKNMYLYLVYDDKKKNQKNTMSISYNWNEKKSYYSFKKDFFLRKMFKHTHILS